MLHEQALLTAEITPFSNKPPSDFSGHWENQLGSTMELTVSGSGVTGTYTSVSSATGDKGGPITGPVKGYTAGDRIAFMVLWPKGSMTAWTGQLVDVDGELRLKTLWHLVTEIPDASEPKFLWMSTFAGADDFSH